MSIWTYPWNREDASDVPGVRVQAITYRETAVWGTKAVEGTPEVWGDDSGLGVTPVRTAIFGTAEVWERPGPSGKVIVQALGRDAVAAYDRLSAG